MQLVVDTSILIAVLGNEPARPKIIKRTKGHELLAPASVHWEIGNAFSAMLKRRRATLDQVLAALKAYDRIPIRFVDVPLDEAVALAGDLGLYAYDAYVLACGRALRAPVLSLDGGLLTAGRAANIAVEDPP